MQEFGLNNNQDPNQSQIRMLTDRVERAQNAADAAVSQAKRAKADLEELETTVGRHGRRTAGSMVALVLVAVLAGVGAWWLNSELNAQGVSLAKLSTISEMVDSLGNRLSNAEATLNDLPNDWESRMNSLEKKFNAGFQSSRHQLNEMVAQMSLKLRSDFGKQMDSLSTHVNTLQSQHDAAADRVASLDNEIKALRDGMGRQIASEIAAVRNSIPRDTAPDIAVLRSGLDRNQRDIAAITDQLDRRRSTFEVSQDNPSEISPGVVITVKKLNVDKQQIDGWVYLPDEHRTLWLNKHGLLEPITFYGELDKQQRDIIITRVTDDDAVGYVLTPRSPAAASSANQN